MYAAMEGPSVRVTTSGKPQSPAGSAHWKAYVVAVASDPTTEATRDCVSAPGMNREMVDCPEERDAKARPRMVTVVECIVMLSIIPIY